MKKNWFTLKADTFLWLKSDKGLVYNAQNRKKFIFPLSNGIENICHKLLDIENLYTIELTDKELNDKDIDKWIHSIIDIEAGYISSNICFEERPISLMPILKVQDNKSYYEEQQKLGFKGKILQNLHELTFYINGNKNGNNEFYKQTIYPIKGNQYLNSSKIISFIKNSRNPYLSNINLVGDIFSYNDFESLINDISNLSISITVYLLVDDFINNFQSLKEIKWPSNVQLNLLVDKYFDITYLKSICIPYIITILIFSEKDITKYSSLSLLESTQKVRHIPIYNNNNLSFFKSYVYLFKEDIENLSLSKNDIFIRQALNINDFGKLTIFFDGKVYANVNLESLGDIDNSPYSIVYHEFTKGNSWFRVRTQKPCNNCIYQWLCPSPSNYEIIINQANLCFFNDNHEIE